MAFDVPTPRISNHSGVIHFASSGSVCIANSDGRQSGAANGTGVRQDRRRRSHSQQHRQQQQQFDQMKMMHHYQYQEKQHHHHSQQYQRHHHLSEERQCTSEGSREEESFIQQRDGYAAGDDDAIGHFCTPPRHSGHVNRNARRSLNVQQHQMRHQLDPSPGGGYSNRSSNNGQRRKTLSAGVADMRNNKQLANAAFSSEGLIVYTQEQQQNQQPQSQHQLQYHSENELEKSSTKSKSLLSRASKKLKKRFSVSNIGKKELDYEEVADGVAGEATGTCIAGNDVNSAVSDDAIDSIQFSVTKPMEFESPGGNREGRDPPPSEISRRGDVKMKRQSRGDGDNRRGSEPDGTVMNEMERSRPRDKRSFPTVELSSSSGTEGDDSTLSTNFTFMLGDVIVDNHSNHEESGRQQHKRVPHRQQKVSGMVAITSPHVNRASTTPATETPVSIKNQKQRRRVMSDSKINSRDATKSSSSSDGSSQQSQKLDYSMGQYLLTKEKEMKVLRESAEQARHEKEEAQRRLEELARQGQGEESAVEQNDGDQSSQSINEETHAKKGAMTKVPMTDGLQHSVSANVSSLKEIVTLKQQLSELRRKNELLTKAESQRSGVSKEVEQLTDDLNAYKKECAAHRERILQKERENAKMEQMLYNERRKVLSLESENVMLLNVADEKIGNAHNSERAKQSELNSYRDQCEKYRDRVLQLERKVITVESALESTGKIARALEDEKQASIPKLEQLKKANAELTNKLSEKESELLAFQDELTALRSKWSTVEERMVQSKEKSDESDKTISVLESENDNLLRKLQLQESTLAQLREQDSQFKQLEADNLSLKRKNDELMSKDLEMKEKLDDSQGIASNTQRIQKMLSDNESFISSLQNNLSQTRTKHHQQILEIRSKYTEKIDSLTDNLQVEKQGQREKQAAIHRLEEKVLTLEQTCKDLEEKGSQQSKSHLEEIAKLMKHVDEMRKQLSESKEQVTALNIELSDMAYEHERRVKGLQRNVSLLERQKAEASDVIAKFEAELTTAREDKRKLHEEVADRDGALSQLRIVTSTQDEKNADEIDRLNNTIQCLKRDVESAELEKQEVSTKLMDAKATLNSQVRVIKQAVADTMDAIRVYCATLSSDISLQLVEEKAQIIRHVKERILAHSRAIENNHLNQAMHHQVAMSSVCSDRSELQQLLDGERDKSHQLQSSIDFLEDEKEALTSTLNAACAKLGATNHLNLLDSIDDIKVEKSQSDSQIATLTVDLTTVQSDLAASQHAREELSQHLNELSMEIEKGRSVVSCLEQTIAASQEEWATERKTLNDEIETLREKARSCDTEIQGLKCNAEKSRQDYDELASQLNETRRELSTANDEVNEKTETIFQLNDRLSRVSQEKADELTQHYMKIEDELRGQLHAVQCERESLERKLAIQQEEIDKTLEESYTTRRELSSLVDQLSVDLVVARNEKNEAESRYSLLETETDCTSIETMHVDQLISTIDKLNTVHVESEREHVAEVDRITKEIIQAHSMETERLRSELSEAKVKIRDLELLLEQSQMESDSEVRLSMHFATQELESHRKDNATLKAMIDDMAKEKLSLEDLLKTIEDESSPLSTRVGDLEQVNSEQEEHIQQLKGSLKSALAELLRVDASRRKYQDQLMEITETVSSYEEENAELKDTLNQSASVISESVGSHEDLKTSIERLVADKKALENDLAETEKDLLESLNSCTHFELKLAKVEQARERQSKESLAEIAHLQEVLQSLEEDWRKESTSYHTNIANLHSELDKVQQLKKEREDELLGQIKVLKQDCQVENLYEELLDKMKDKEMQYEMRIHTMDADIVSLTNGIESLSRERNELVSARDNLMLHNKGLVERLEALKSELDSIRQKQTACNLSLDDISTTSSRASRSSHQLKQTASELEATITAIKRHHSTTVQKLQDKLNDYRRKLQKSERKVSDLSKLLKENSSVIAALHKKLVTSKRRSTPNSTTQNQQQLATLSEEASEQSSFSCGVLDKSM